MSQETARIIANIKGYIIYPIIGFMFAVATVMFIYGIVEYMLGAENPEKRDKGKKHMIWGIVGVFVMLSAYGIMNVLADFWWQMGSSVY